MTFTIHSLQTRIVVFFTLLLLSLQVGDGLLLTKVGTANARKTIGDELQTGERVFRRLLDQNALQLAQGARILSSDFAFREALATGDRETIISALTNHGARINAQAMMLVGLDRRIIADTTTSDRANQPFPLPNLITQAEQTGKASVITSLNGHLYQLVLVPVLAPLPIAWVAMGFRVDDTTALDLKKLTGLNVSFLTRATGERWAMAASTLPAEQREAITTTIPAAPIASPFGMFVADEEYVTLVSQQLQSKDESVIAVLQYSLQDALAPFHQLLRNMMLLSILGIVISIFSSYLVARGIARPVAQLTAFARRIAGGDYATPPPINRHDEIGDLASAFDHMRNGIVSREEKITDLAYRDPLTCLPNRTLFNDRLAQAINTARRQGIPASILLLNLDDFRGVNESLGHVAGDTLLQQVALRLQGVIRRQSDTIARRGGDEFAVLLNDEDVDGAGAMCERLLRALETPIQIADQPVDIRASIGVAVFPQHGDDAETLLRHADIALSLAKKNNTGHAIFDPRFEERGLERLSLIGELRQAVEQNQLMMYYQPKIDLAGSGELYAEALVRWQHPVRGFVPPMEFIPFAEQTGYIKVITLWVLNNSIEQCARWRNEGLPVNFSINLSTRDLLNPELSPRLEHMLTEHGCKAEWITLEITESATIDDPNHALRNLEHLHAMGFRLSIDDFGTGYSSLSYLKRLPVDELKIDKSFVFGMVKDPDDKVIVRSTIDLAHNMGLKVVAEGVENQEILDALREMGCDVAQGYLISKPIAVADYAVWLRESPWLPRRTA